MNADVAGPRADADQDPVRLLWTGGWDSSFRLMQLLLLERRAVQPIYVLTPDRTTARLELRAIERMRDGLRPRLADPALLRPLQILLASDHRPTSWQRAAFDAIRARAHLGTQYLALAGVAETQGWRDVEVSVERYTSPDGLSAWSRMLMDSPGVLGQRPEAQLLKYWSFPVMHLTKEDMGQIAAQEGFLDLLRLRWFCHDPVGEKACGRCRPCRLANRDAVDFAPPALSLAREALREVRRAVRQRRSRTRAESVRP